MKRKNIFFWKLLVSFVSLLIPMVVLTVLFYIRTVDNEKEVLMHTMQQSVYSTVNSLDTSISTARSAALVFLNQDVVSVLGYSSSGMSVSKKLEQIQLIKQFAYTRQVVGGISDDMFLYGDDKTVYADGSYLFDDYFGHLAVFDSFGTNYWKKLLLSNSPFQLLEPTTLTVDGGNIKKTVVPLVMGDTINGQKIKLVLCLSAEEMENKLNMSVAQKDMQFLVLSDSGKAIVNTADKSSCAYLEKTYQRQKGIFEFQADTQKYIGVCVYSNTFGWRYFAVLPVSAIQYEANSLLILLLVSVSMLLAGIFFAVRLTLSIYRPIQNIQKALSTEPDLKDVSCSSLDQIEKKVEKLIMAYSKTSDENRMVVTDFIDESLSKLLNGQNLEKCDRVQMLLQRVYGFSSIRYLCVGIRMIVAREFSTEVQDTERFNLISVMQQAISDILSGYVPSYVMEYAEQTYICMLNTGNEEVVKAALHQLTEVFADYSSYLSFTAAVGNPVDELSEIRQPFLQIFAALHDAKPYGVSRIIDAKDFAVSHHYDYKLQDEFELTHLLKSGNINDILAKINGILDECFTRDASPDGVQLLVQTFYFTGMRFLAERNETLSDVDRYLELRYGENVLRNMDKTKEMLRCFFEEIVNVTSLHTKETNLSDTIQNYVQANYSKDLYLEKIAEDMGLSAKYVSRIFKKTTGKNLTDYINDVRMAHVRQMLTKTDLSIKEISEAVGIFSRSTFIRLFKKSMNVTPSEYRNIFK